MIQSNPKLKTIIFTKLSFESLNLLPNCKSETGK